MTMLSIQTLTKLYDGIPVVDDVSLEIPKGKVTSLIGPNGAGKSTVLGIAARLLAAEHGDVLFDGRSIKSWNTRALARRLAVLHRLLHVGDRVVAEGDAVGPVLLQPGGRLRDERHARIGTRHFSGGKAKRSGRGGSAEDQAGDECACCGSKAGSGGRNAVHGPYFLGSVRSSHEPRWAHKRETAHGKSRMPH